MGKKNRKAERFTAAPQWSVGDPAFAEWLRTSCISTGTVSEDTAAGLSAWYRADALISGTIAGLPLKVYQGSGSQRREVPHFLADQPAGPYDMSAFSWTETVVLHLLNHAEAYLKGIHNGAGELIGLYPIHPLAITKVTWDGPDKAFEIALKGGGKETLTSGDVTQVLGMSFDGLRGVSPLTAFRQTLQTSLAGERAANRAFTTGALIAGMVTTEEDVAEDEAKRIKSQLNAKIAGAENAGDIAFVNRALKFSPWTMTNADAQFVESRSFQLQEVARIKGLPTSLLSVAGAVSNWGTGVAESFLGLQKYTLMAHTSRIESALKAILPPGWTAEYDYHGLLQGTPKDEIELLIAQVSAGLLTGDEAREILNRPALPAMPAPRALEAVS